YAGVSLTRSIGHKSADGDTYMDLWALPAGTQPATGANNVVVTFSGASCTGGGSWSVHSGVFSAKGVNQNTTFTSTAVNDDGNVLGTTASVTLPSSGTHDLVVDFVCSGTANNTTTQ